MGHPYPEIDKSKLILRDYLAIDRTKLASERTMLAYVRTALTLAVAGITIGKFFPEFYYQAVAWVFLMGAVVLTAYCIYRFGKQR